MYYLIVDPLLQYLFFLLMKLLDNKKPIKIRNISYG